MTLLATCGEKIAIYVMAKDLMECVWFAREWAKKNVTSVLEKAGKMISETMDDILSLCETIHLMAEVDGVIESAGGWAVK